MFIILSFYFNFLLKKFALLKNNEKYVSILNSKYQQIEFFINSQEDRLTAHFKELIYFNIINYT